MVNIMKLVCPHIKELNPYSSARDEMEGSNVENRVFLDANENPYGTFNRYPDPYQNMLKARLSEIKSVLPDQIFLGNGSDEIINLLINIFCNPGSDKVMIFDPTFGMYETAAMIHNSELVRIELNEQFNINLDDVIPYIGDPNLKLIFICSPNNPTGNIINREAIQYLLENFESIIVVDEAYIDFSLEESWKDSIEQYSNLVVLQTLSKAWGMAGLRLGMALANPKIIHYLNKVKAPYNISSMTQEMVLERLGNIASFQKQVDTILTEKKRMAEALNEIDFIKKVYPSQTNFILVEMDDANRIHAVLSDRGIIVRDRSKQVKQCLRITIGSPKENNLLISTLNKITE